MIRRLYYAGPLFTAAERAWNAANAVLLRQRLAGTTLLLPQDFCAACEQPGRPPDFGAIFAACRDHLVSADAVLAILDGADADSGTCWEIGFATARGLPVVGLRTDLRPAEDGGGNCMLTRSCVAVVRDLDAAIAALKRLPG